MRLEKEVCDDPRFDMKSSGEVSAGLQYHQGVWQAVRATRLVVNLENDALASSLGLPSRLPIVVEMV